MSLRACTRGRMGRSSGRRERPDCSAASWIIRCQRWILVGPVSSKPAIERRQMMGEKTETPSSVPFSRIHSKRADLRSPWWRMIRTAGSLLPGRRSIRWTSTAALLVLATVVKISSPLLSSKRSCSPTLRRITSRIW